MTETLTKAETQEKIAALLAAAERCNCDAWIDTGECYALKSIAEGFHRPQWFASDGTRWWRNPCLVLTIDIYNEELVTAHYSLRRIPTLPRTLVKAAGFKVVVPPALPEILDVSETLIFDHTQRGDTPGGPKKEVYRYGPTG